MKMADYPDENANNEPPPHLFSERHSDVSSILERQVLADKKYADEILSLSDSTPSILATETHGKGPCGGNGFMVATLIGVAFGFGGGVGAQALELGEVGRMWISKSRVACFYTLWLIKSSLRLYFMRM